MKQPHAARHPDASSDLDVAIIGSGFAGICMGIQLKKAGIGNFLIFEKAGRIGGTWRDNTYPGCGCDVPSFLYSFSFEIKTDWSRRFAEQPEILGYLEHCARKYGLEPHFRFNTEISSARFDSSEGLWRIQAAGGQEFTAKVLITGCGQLNRPLVPQIEGLADFRGTIFHSARWRHDHDLTGKRVAVIGNGASALQFVPIIAPKPDKLYLLQRSPNWIVPKSDHEYSAKEKAFFAHWPLAARLYRWLIYWQLEARWPLFFLQNGLSRWFARKTARDIARQFRDPKLAAALTPDYPIGCKRILQSGDYYQALARDNVEVVTNPIKRIEADSIQMADGRSFEVDTIIFATGFETTGFLAPMEITGRNGVTLREAWREGAEAYLGVAVPDFPNFFLLYGPNTNLGHNSIVFMIECQVRYIIQCIDVIERRDLRSLDLRRDRMKMFSDEIQNTLRDSVWATGCSSWYKNESGRITNNWAYGTLRYWWRLRHPDWSAYDFETR